MAIPTAFLELVQHPAPGLHFPAHEVAGTPERVLPSPHRLHRPASAATLRKLDQILAAAPAEAAAELREFYTRWNGADLCCLPDGREQVGMLSLLPIQGWKAATEMVTEGPLSYCMKRPDGKPFWAPEDVVVIASAQSEETRLVLAMAGQWDDGPLAGRICYVAMDPVHAAGQPIADGFFDLLKRFAKDPAAFLAHISSTYFVKTRKGMWGDVADRYLPDCRTT